MELILKVALGVLLGVFILRNIEIILALGMVGIQVLLVWLLLN